MTTQIVTQRILTADKGKYLTNGETYGTTVVLPFSADEGSWYEITEEAYQEIMKSMLPDDMEIENI